MAQEDVVTGVICYLLLYIIIINIVNIIISTIVNIIISTIAIPMNTQKTMMRVLRRSPKIKHFHGANILLCSEAQVIERILF